MNFKSVKECEKKSTLKLLNFKLPNHYKKIGWIGFFIVFAIVLSTKFVEGDFELTNDILRKVMIGFLFMVVLSKEKIEDERIQSFRAQSYSLAFLAGVLYTLFQPLINWLVFTIIKPEKAVFEDLGDFQILWMMLVVYLMFFYFLKKQG
tara:strand:- start:139673 stop:140119 length:447 start_codon:yes stop_codon:yes gene_type:complete